MTRKTILLAASFLLLLTAAAGCGAGVQQEELSSGVSQVIEQPEFERTSWSIQVVDLETGEVLEQMNHRKMLDPASTTKLFSVASALEVLGPDHRFRTPVYLQGPLDASGQLDGNLVLVASGDMAMGGRVTPDGEIEYTAMDHTEANVLGNAILTPTDPLAGLNELAGQVAASGVKSVDGDVLVDARLFPTEKPLGDPEEHVTSPIVINDNLVDITVTPTSSGSPAEITWRPQSAAFTVLPSVTTVDSDGITGIEVASDGPGIIAVSGTIAQDGGDVVRTWETGDPESFARTLFIEALERAGITVNAPAVAPNPVDLLPPHNSYQGMEQAAELVSPPFSEYAKLILKVSLNYGANTLLPLMAVHEGGADFYEGLGVMRSFLVTAGVDVNSLVINDGAGAAGSDYIPAEPVTQLLRYMSTSDNYRVFREGLPVMGVDGTLAGILPESRIAGKVHAKTGTHATLDMMNQRLVLTARALGGYMSASSGRELALHVSAVMIVPDEETDMMDLARRHATVLEAIYDRH